MTKLAEQLAISNVRNGRRTDTGTVNALLRIIDQLRCMEFAVAAKAHNAAEWEYKPLDGDAGTKEEAEAELVAYAEHSPLTHEDYTLIQRRKPGAWEPATPTEGN